MGLFGLFGKKKKEDNTLQDAPGNSKKENNAAEGEQKNRTGGFVSFVLLSEPRWDKDAFFRTLREEWKLTPDAEDEDEAEEEKDDTAVFTVNGTMIAVSLMPAPVPNGEVEQYAPANYTWPEAAEVSSRHTAHLLIAVMGNEKDPVGAGKLFTAVAASCLVQPNVLGIYTSGTVLSPDYFLRTAKDLKDGQLPIMSWVFVFLYRGKQGFCGYTIGLETFGREELEVLDSSHQPSEILPFLYDICSYLISGDVYLRDGETIGSSAEEKLPITRSPGVSLPGMTLKIGF